MIRSRGASQPRPLVGDRAQLGPGDRECYALWTVGSPTDKDKWKIVAQGPNGSFFVDAAVIVVVPVLLRSPSSYCHQHSVPQSSSRSRIAVDSSRRMGQTAKLMCLPSTNGVLSLKLDRENGVRSSLLGQRSLSNRLEQFQQQANLPTEGPRHGREVNGSQWRDLPTGQRAELSSCEEG